MSRNVVLLSFCQAIYMSIVVILVTTAPLIGIVLAANAELATVPIGMLDISMLFTAYIASILMGHFGRRRGFIIGAVLGIFGAATVIVSLFLQSFLIFCIGLMGIGSYFAYAQYYRFAAVEVSGCMANSQAISYVLGGGLAAAFIGPAVTKFTRGALPIDFAGNYLAIILLCAISIIVLSKLEIPEKTNTPPNEEELPPQKLTESVIYNRWLIVAIIGAVVSYGVMALIMTATPLSMNNHGHHFSHTASVMQWHFIGMFAPSFFTGNLIKKYGVNTVMLAGGVILVLSSFAGITGISMQHYTLSLLLLGLGWNFLFIGSTTLLSGTFTDTTLKARAEGLNETFVSATMVITSLTSGVMHELFGWEAIHYMSIGIVTVSMLIILIIQVTDSRKSVLSRLQNT